MTTQFVPDHRVLFSVDGETIKQSDRFRTLFHDLGEKRTQELVRFSLFGSQNLTPSLANQPDSAIQKTRNSQKT